jgi:hypothetical protein
LTILNYKIKLNLGPKSKQLIFFILLIIGIFKFILTLENRVKEIENTTEILEKIIFIEMEKSMASRYYTPRDPTSGLTGLTQVMETLKQRKAEEAAVEKKNLLQAKAAEVYKTGDPQQIADFSIRNPEMADILSQATAFKSKKTEDNYKDSLISFFVDPTEKNVLNLLEKRKGILNQEGVPPEQSVETDTFLQRFREDPEKMKQQVATELAFRYPKQWESVQKYLAESGPELATDERTPLMKNFDEAVKGGYPGTIIDFNREMNATDDFKRFKEAQKTGYPGTYMEFIAPEKEDTNLNKPTDDMIEYLYSKENEGYPGTFLDYNREKNKAQTKNPEIIDLYNHVVENEDYGGSIFDFVGDMAAAKNPSAELIEYKYIKKHEGYPGTFLTYQSDSKPVDETALMKEYKFYQKQGYPGTIFDFEEDRLKMKMKYQLTPKRRDYEHAKSEGFTGDYIQYQHVINGTGPKNDLLRAQLLTIQDARIDRIKKAKELEGIEDKKVRYIVGGIDSVIEEISKAVRIAENSLSATGLTGAVTGLIPSTPAYVLKRRIQTIKANIGFDKLQAMRDASPTGGALGQVSERELEFLQSTITSLDPGMGEKELLEGLKKVEEHYNNMRDIVTGKTTEEDAQKMLGWDSVAEPGEEEEEPVFMEGYGIPVIESDKDFGNIKSGTEFMYKGTKYTKE